MIAIDLFSGAGGLTRGLLNAGIHVVVGIDINPDYKSTYEANNVPSKFLCRDISDVTAEDIRPYLPAKQKDELALVGCAPCQPFSSHRRSRSACNESRLLLEFGRLVTELCPDWVFMENVPGIAKVAGFSAFRRFTKILSDLKYKFKCDTVDAKRFGVPQTRRRFVLIASKSVVVSLPPETHGSARIAYRTVRDAIGHLPKIAAGENHPTVANHRAAELSALNLRRLKRTPADGGGRLDWPAKLELECHKNSAGHEDAYGRMRWGAPAPTLTCRCFSISNGRYGHPEQHRAISLREAANIQSFPEDYAFSGVSIRSLGEQIGNAVPVKLAEAVGNQLLHLSSTRKKPRRTSKRPRKKLRRTK